MGKWAIVTGGGTGIGKASALRLARQNYNVLILGRRKEVLERAQVEITDQLDESSVKIEAISCDLTLRDQLDSSLSNFLNNSEIRPHLKILVNNAGQFLRESFEESKPDSWQRLFDVNLMGVVNISQLLWPIFKENRGGRIINISSTLGLKPVPGTLAYSCLKSALNSLTEGMALEGAEHNILVNSILPGIVDTPIHDFHSQSREERGELQGILDSMQPLGRIGNPDEIAEAVAYFSSPHSTWTTGSLLKVDGGIHLTSKEPS